eukprot:2212086-Amphidinium_carterae.1
MSLANFSAKHAFTMARQPNCNKVFLLKDAEDGGAPDRGVCKGSSSAESVSDSSRAVDGTSSAAGD